MVWYRFFRFSLLPVRLPSNAGAPGENIMYRSEIRVTIDDDNMGRIEDRVRYLLQIYQLGTDNTP